MVEQRPFKPKVVGSIPTAPTNIFLILLRLKEPEGVQRSIKNTLNVPTPFALDLSNPSSSATANDAFYINATRCFEGSNSVRKGCNSVAQR